MTETMLRLFTMLRMLPRSPRKIDTAALERRLHDEGYPVTRRTIQRDLHQLARIFPLLCDDHRPGGWSWAPDTAPMDLPGMDPSAALTFTLVERFLAPLLPCRTFGRIQPYLTQAQQILDALPANALGRWPAKVRVIHRGPRLRLPEIDETVLDAVTRGLLDGRQLDVAYRSREKDDILQCVLNPLGLVVKDNILLLVCTFWHYTDIRQVVVHRVHRAEVLDVPARVSEGFDLDAYIEGGAFSYPVGEPIALEAVFWADAHRHLHDTPLSADQVITALGDDRVLVRATVQDTAELRWWLLGFGELVEVLAPRDLREEFRARAVAMAERYQQPSPSVATRPRRRRVATDGEGCCGRSSHPVPWTRLIDAAVRPAAGPRPWERDGGPEAADADATGRRVLIAQEGRERLSHEPGSRLERLERRLRQRWREAKTPEVGHFYRTAWETRLGGAAGPAVSDPPVAVAKAHRRIRV